MSEFKWIAAMFAVLAVGVLAGCRSANPIQEGDQMELLICGSGASEGMPSIYCVCDFCEKTRVVGGKNQRLRTSYMLGDKIWIDWGPDSVAQSQRFGLKPWNLEHIFITHSHEDHLFPMDFWIRGVSQLPEGKVVNLYGNEQVLKAVGDYLGNDWARYRIRPVLLEPGQTVEADGYRVTALLADHTWPEKTLLYVFEKGGRRLMIGNDTGYFPEETWQALAGKTLDVMTIDATWGMTKRTESHLGLLNIIEMQERLKSIGAITDRTRIIPVHFAHGEHAMLHDQMEHELAPYGMEPAFDGMRLEW